MYQNQARKVRILVGSTAKMASRRKQSLINRTI